MAQLGLPQGYKQSLYWPGLVFHLGLPRGRKCFQIHIAVGSIQFLTGCQTEKPQFLTGCEPEAALSNLSHNPLCMGAPDMIVFFFKDSKRESPSKTCLTILFNIIQYIINHISPINLCHILLIRSKSQDPSTLGGGGITSKWRWGRGDDGDHPRVSLPCHLPMSS